MVSDTTVENACLEKVSQALFGVSLCMPEQAVGKLKHGGGGEQGGTFCKCF